MASHVETTWTSGLISAMNSDVAAQIISRVADFGLIIDGSGKISGAQSSLESVDQAHIANWSGQQMQSTLTVESVPKFESRLAQFLAGQSDVLPVELNHKASGDFSKLPVRYSFHHLNDQGAVLMLGSDLRRTAEMQQQLVSAQIALEADYEAQREQDIRLRVLMESSDVATVFISVATGHVVSCNTATEVLLGKSKEVLIDTPFANEFEAKGRKDIVERLISAAAEQSQPPVIAKSAQGTRKLSLSPTLFRGSSSQMVLCKITSIGVQSGTADQLQHHLADLFRSGVDSIVFVTEAGIILSANEAFLKLAHVAHSQSVIGRSFIDFCARGTVDLNVMIENARRSGGMRLYATKVTSAYGGERAVEISTSVLKAGVEAVFALVIRDSHRVETVSTSNKHITDVDMNSVIELIGGQSLKDIVAKTTDVVEKMCIETAVQMTSNNRVAAAEMLGLSRQSLYVKLRKYDLISKT
ncbi:MAG: transcriptional regulator PpsR [Paracoccaceae bacterium]